MTGIKYDNFLKEQKTGEGRRFGHFAAASACLLVALLILVSSLRIRAVARKDAGVVPDFTLAIEERRYGDALQIYRSVHDIVVSQDDPGTSDDQYIASQREQMDQMEQIVNEQLQMIEDQMRNSRYVPSAADLRFMNELQELTTSAVSEWLNELCAEFLLGTIEKPDLMFIFEQMKDVGNISSTATPLLYEVETIERARGDARAAEEYFNDGDYVSAVKRYVTVSDSYEGFVHDYALNRLNEIKQIMYDPMLLLGEHMLLRYKYYSAEALLSDLAVIFPGDPRINADLLEATSNTFEVTTYRGTVQVLCIRQLIADVTRGASSTGLYLTCEEFERMLNELYSNDYVLVDAETMADLTEDTFITEVDLTVPVGKKPLILVLDTFDYNVASTYNYGLCTMLSLDDQEHILGQYIEPDGTLISGRNLEAIGILDQFVEEHPDFSFDGAKGVISISGYESVFGMVISRDEADDRSQALANIGRPNVEFTDSEIELNRQTVSEIMSILQDTGWKIASSTYGAINAFESDMDTIVSDTSKWMEQIEPLAGDVHIIVYPGGNYIYGTDPRAVYLKNNGFRIFFGIGHNPYHIYGDNYLYYDRTVVSEHTLMNNDFSDLFDVTRILDAYFNSQEEQSYEEESDVI